MLKQFIPQEFCLKCQGCCRFNSKKSPWIAQITNEEILRLVKQGAPPAVFSKSDKQDHFLDVEPDKETYYCVFLTKESNKCSIYENHPFDCRLYPFILEKHGKNIALGLHLECPFVKENLDKKEFNEYVKYLKEFLNSQEVSAFIKKNSFLAGNYAEYQSEIKTICLLK